MVSRRIPFLFILGLLLLLLPIVHLTGQSGGTSSVSIPGVDSKYNTDKLIEKTMEAERTSLERMQESKKSYAKKKEVWNELSSKLESLAQEAKKLYGFENPFQEYVASSSNSSIVTATAQRNAESGTHTVEVEQLASKDVFLSRSLPEDYQIPQGEYGFSLGDKEISVSFDGGDVRAFAKKINNRSKGLVNVRTVKDTPNTRVLVFEGGKPGTQHPLSFNDAAEQLGVDTGMLKRSRKGSRSISPSASNVSANRGEAEAVEISEGTLRVAPQASARMRISPGAQLSGSQQLKIHVRVENLPEEEEKKPSPPPGPSIPQAGGVELEGIRVENLGPQVELPDPEQKEAPKKVETLEVLSINDSVKLPALEESEGEQTLSLAADELPGTITSIDVNNPNTHRIIHFTGAEVVDPQARGDYVPANPVSTAADARVKVDGVTITRSNNQIEEAIPGVILQPQSAGQGSAEISIDPDIEAIKNAIFNFAGTYNQVLTDVHILTSNKESVIEEISYFEEKEREEAREKLGLFQGETTFMQLRNRLQRIVTAPYDTSEGNRLAMLSQIGISSNASGFGGGVERRRLRGYLEVNEKELEKALDNSLPAIKQLFGRDSSGDLTVDSGLAYRIHNFAREYTKNGGIISTRVAGIERRIGNTEEDIREEKDDLQRKRQNLKRKYGRMESTIGKMEENSSALQRLNGGQ